MQYSCKRQLACISSLALKRLFKAFRAWRLERKEKRLLRKQAEIGNKYNVIKNVSTHSMLNDPDGEIDMKFDLEDTEMCLNKSLDNNIHMAEKMTQTDLLPMSSSLVSSIAILKTNFKMLFRILKMETHAIIRLFRVR